tara:strand:- start:878 stop:4288 length:3411 start_codon:yes stop_codon:yes gene_type:complete
MTEFFNVDGTKKEFNEPAVTSLGTVRSEENVNLGEAYNALIDSRYKIPYEFVKSNLLGGDWLKNTGGKPEWKVFPPFREEGFAPLEYIKEKHPNYVNQTQVWIHGNNKAHVDWLISYHERNIVNRGKLDTLNFGWRMGVEVFDPINIFVPLRLARGTSSVLKNTLTGGAYSGALQAPQLATDPTYTVEMYITEMAFSGAAFAAIGKAVNMKRNGTIHKILNNSETRLKNYHKAITKIDKEVLTSKAERQYFDISDEKLILKRAEEVKKATKEGELLDTTIIQSIDKEIAIRKIQGNKTNFEIAPSKFTDSFLYNMISTPLKRISRSGIQAVQDLGFSIAYDSGVLLKAHTQGKKLKASVFQLIKKHDGDLKMSSDKFFALWGEDKVGGSTQILDLNITPIFDKLTLNKNTFDNWLGEVSEAYIKRTDPKLLTKPQREALIELETYFKKWKEDLTETGQISTLKSVSNDILRINNRILEVEKTKKTLAKTDTELSSKANFEIINLKIKIEKLNITLKTMKKAAKENTDRLYPVGLDDVFFPRFWDRASIKNNPEGFHKILREYMLTNPNMHTLKRPKKTLKQKRDKTPADFYGPTTQFNVDGRVDSIVQSILNKNYGEDFYGHGVGKHLNRKIIAIPNSLVTEFIETNPITVMKAYSNKTAPVYEFKKMYANKGFDEVRNDLRFDLELQKIPQKEINKAMRDIEHLYDSVTLNLLRNPDAWNMKITRLMKDLAQLNYLGSSGFTTIVEPAKIIMEHGFKPTMKALLSVIEDPIHWRSRIELQKAGEGLDTFLGSVQNRISDGIKSNQLPTAWDKSKNGFYILNGLSWATRILKDFDAVVRQHSIIEMSVNWSNGKASKMEQEYLLRYGIDQNDALEIATMPWETTKNGFYLANTDAWTNASTKQVFQTALSSGVLNTIMMGTPADKPIVMSGIFYVPMNVGRKFNMKEDPIVKGYARIENGILSMPFQFYSYMMAAVNKTAAGYAHGQMKGKTSGILAALGLGYMLLRIKTSDRTYDNMTNRDKFFRAFDYGGVTAIYNDMFYTLLHTVSEATGKNITGGLVGTKYNTSNAEIMETVVGLGGAGPSITYDILDGLKDFLSGDFSEAASKWVRNAPGSQLWFAKDTTNDFVRVLAGRH